MAVPEVILEDQTLRDGLQIESRLFSIEEKQFIIEELVESGFKRIQIGAFVRTSLVPQMRNIRHLFQSIQGRGEDDFSALILNEKGLENAISDGVKRVSIAASASETHSLKNNNMERRKAVPLVQQLIQRAKRDHLMVQANIMCSFGCAYEGRVPKERVIKMAKDFMAAGADEIAFSDSPGMADPKGIQDMVTSFQASDSSGIPVLLHLHDTRGLGLANMFAGYEKGVRRFDVCVGGLGGCPFITGAAGNVAAEDAIHMFERMGVLTGIDLKRICDLVGKLEKWLNRTLPGRVSRIAASGQTLFPSQLG